MSTIRILPDDVMIEAAAGETLLAASLSCRHRAAHECGGHARCSTCRIEVVQGIENCAPRTDAEQALAERLGFSPTLRLACQTIPRADMIVAAAWCSMMTHRPGRSASTRCCRAGGGRRRELAIVFSDIRGFTAFSEMLPPHDVVQVLNRYFHVSMAIPSPIRWDVDN